MAADKEYIERGSIYRRVKTHTNPYGKPTLDYESGVKVLDMIKQEPAADVVEVRHGEWKLIETEGFCDGGFYSRFCCPLCLREIGVCHDYEKDAYNYAKIMYPYCHCGAKMDGERKDIP